MQGYIFFPNIRIYFNIFSFDKIFTACLASSELKNAIFIQIQWATFTKLKLVKTIQSKIHFVPDYIIVRATDLSDNLDTFQAIIMYSTLHLLKMHLERMHAPLVM